MIQCPNMPENTGPWHRTSEHSSPGAHPVVFSIPTSVNTNNGLSVPFGSGTVRNLMPGQPHQMHTNILLDPSLCVLRGSPVATSAFLSTLSAPDLLNKIWVVLAKCIQSSTKSGIGWDWWTYFSSCSELEIVLRPQKCYWAQITRGHTCACAVQKPTCNSAIILSPSSSSSSFTADATASPVFRDNVWSSLGVLDCATCPASSLHSYKGMKKHRQPM